MNFKCVISTLSVLFSLIVSSVSDAAEKITISYSSRTYAFLPAQVAVVKGFLREENLDPVLIQMRSQVTVPALMSGEVNYTLSFGNILAGAMQGMPFKILAVLTDKPLHHIVARPEIKTIAACVASVSVLKESVARINLRLKRFFKRRGWISKKS